MGDGCFHPQLGLIPREGAKEEKPIAPKEIELKTFNSHAVNMIDCKDDYYFDVFCGKAKGVAKLSDLEVWVDTSGSMKNVDYSSNPEFCERRRWVSTLESQCPGAFSYYLFDTSKKLMGTKENLCVSRGLNDGKRLVRWLKNSSAKEVWILTDVDEYNNEFREYIDTIGATIHGIGTSPLKAAQMSVSHNICPKR